MLSNNGISLTSDFIMDLVLHVSVPEASGDLTKDQEHVNRHNAVISTHTNLCNSSNITNMPT